MTEKNMARAHETHESRISRLETSVATLAEGMSHLQEGQREQRVQMSRGFEELKRLDGKRVEQTQWTVSKVSAIIGGTLLLGGAFLSPYFFIMNGHSADIKEIKQQQAMVAQTRWERADAERAIDLAEKAREQDRKLTADTFKQQREYIDKRDERVLGLSVKTDDELRAQILQLEKRFNSHEVSAAEANGRQDEMHKRYAAEEGRAYASVQALQERVRAIEAELSHRAAVIESVEAEQARRRPIVYDATKVQ